MHKCAFALESYRRCRRANTRPHACMHVGRQARSQRVRRNRTDIRDMAPILESTHLVRNCVASFDYVIYISNCVGHLFIESNAKTGD